MKQNWRQTMEQIREQASKAYSVSRKQWQTVLSRLRTVPGGTFLTSPSLWLSLGIVAAVTLCVFLYYYVHYANIIETRVRAGFVTRTVDIYTSPLRLHPGLDLSADELKAYLDRVGYVKVTDRAEPGTYQDWHKAIVVVPRETARSAVSIEYKNDKIDRIVDMDRGGESETYELPGILVGALSNGERCRRRPLSFEKYPQQVKDAIFAIEDRRFFEHPGVDYRGVLRALFINLDQGKVVQGGSTITQQLIKMVFNMSERTYERKVQEAFLALALERNLSKEEIFTTYANEVYLGQHGDVVIRGFAEGAQYYFGKELDKLTVAETALLAGLIRGPSYYSPISNPQRALARRNEVLQAMLEMEALNKDEYQQAVNSPLKVTPRDVLLAEAPYFLDFASKQVQPLLAQLPEYGRYRATVTLDLELQKAAEAAISKHVDRLRRSYRNDKLEAALVALEPNTGNILALVGGRFYNKSGFDRATMAKRQPGSAFKPFVYTAALQSGQYTPASIMRDEEQVFIDDLNKEYKPKNHGGHFSGKDVTLRHAFAQSLNTVTVGLASDIGLENIADVAERAGLPRPKPYLSMALGTFETTPLELAAAYGTFVNGGQYVSPRAIVEITDESGRLLAAPSQSIRSVCSPSISYLMVDLMQAVINEGTGRPAAGLQSLSAIAGKTGTSRDGWFVGFTPKLVVAVWVGFDDYRDLKLTGGHSALPIWSDFLKKALARRPDLRGKAFERPTDVMAVKIDADTGYLATDQCVNVREELVATNLMPIPCDHALWAANRARPANPEPFKDDHIVKANDDSDDNDDLERHIRKVSNRKKARRVLTNDDFERGETSRVMERTDEHKDDEDKTIEREQELEEEDD